MNGFRKNHLKIKNLIFIYCLLALGCQKELDKTQKVKDVVEKEQKHINYVNEKYELLSAKYGISAIYIFEIISEYEELTKGYSLCEFETKKATLRNTDNKKVIDIASAIEKISTQHGVAKDIIGKILIDYWIFEQLDYLPITGSE